MRPSFDLDATLLYTLEDLTKATNYARRMNMPERTLMMCAGLSETVGAPDRAGGSGGERHRKSLSRRLRFSGEYYDIHCNDNTKAYDGVIDLLRELKADGCACDRVEQAGFCSEGTGGDLF